MTTIQASEIQGVAATVAGDNVNVGGWASPLPEEIEWAVEPLPVDEPSLLALADRLLRELGDARGERTANQAALKIEVDRLRTLYGDLDTALGQREQRLVRELAQITAVLPLRGKKSRKLAFGTLKYRTSPERLAISDEKVLREEIAGWAPEIAAQVLKDVAPKIVHAELVKLWKNTGVVPPGCEVTPEQEEFSAET